MMNTNPIYSKDFAYRFYMLSIPVAKFLINDNRESNIFADESRKIEFQLSTSGPLKLFRSYSSEGYIDSNKNGWNYYLSGSDRGYPEEKLIEYSINGSPVIKKFIDDKGVNSLTVNQTDRDSIDPFSLLLRTIDQLRSEQQCDNNYSIMDGKRRYKVKVDLLRISDIRLGVESAIDYSLYECEFIMIEQNNKYNRWPFDLKKKSIKIWFSEELNYYPIEFNLKTPVGRIKGILVEG